MRDARFGSALLLSLRFTGPGPDIVLRRRVSELGLRRRTRGRRAGLHCVRSRCPYVLTSTVLGSVPVITGNRPLRHRAVSHVADPASVPPSSVTSSRSPVEAARHATDCLIRPALQRHVFHQTRQLRCATLNVRSLANKVDVVGQCWRDAGLDILGLTETWHEDADDVALRRLRSTGLQMLERARPVRPGARTDDIFYQNHGGVAVIASAAVRLSKITAPFEPITFEHLIARVTVSGNSFVFVVVYRPGSAAVTAAFFDEFRRLLEFLSSFAMPYVITGDLNIRFDRPDDPTTLRATELLEMYGAVQSVTSATHDRGGILDVVVTRADEIPSAVDVISVPGGASDHRLVTWPFLAAPAETPVYRTQHRRSWRQFDIERFRSDLAASCLCDGMLGPTSCDDASVAALRFDEVVTALLDAHAPMADITCRVRASSDKWYDSECRSAKRHARRFERRYKKTRSATARECWVESLGSMHRLVQSKRGCYWRSKVDTRLDPASLWRAINDGLGRKGDGAPSPAPGLSAEAFADFFDQKVSDVRSATDGAPPPVLRDIQTADRFLSFAPVTSDVVCRMVNEAVDKYSMKDPMPTWLLKSCIDLLAPYIASVFNSSLSSGAFPTCYKDAYVTPRLKKATLSPCELSSYRPISNLSFLSKLLERVVSVQLTEYLSSAGLLPVHQSAYRKYHSTETALLKVVTDLTEAIEAGDHALLGLLDLSAAFDTVDHDVLVERLSRTYGIRSAALDWLRSYLCDRRQTVLFDGVLSTVRSLSCGVPQGSVLGPLLFLLYTADVGELAASLGLSSHFYADDSQLYTWGPPSTVEQQRRRMELGIERHYLLTKHQTTTMKVPT